MFLGIEIGGTKLQLGVGAGDGKLVALDRRDVVIEDGAEAIRRQIAEVARTLIATHRPQGIGYGFGGPLDLTAGRTVTSHQVAGWDDFPLAQWTRDTFGLPVVLNNDCDAAALAEARIGAAASKRIVFYVTVGTGVGGGLVIDGQIHRGGRGVAAEIGHLRPGLHCESVEQTVEAAVAGPGIVASVRETIERFGIHLQNPYGKLPRIGELAHAEPDANEPLPPALRQWCGDPARDGEVLRDIAQLDALDGGDAKKLTAKDIFVAASQGNHIAAAAVMLALRTLGWAIAQTVTLIAPDIVVVGGGVSLAGEAAFFAPLREEAARFAFPPLRESYTIVPAALGEDVVVHGAILAARDALHAG